MSWDIADPYLIEEDLEAMGADVWGAWLGIRSPLLDDPTPTNERVTITETPGGFQVWIPGTSVYVQIFHAGEQKVVPVLIVDLLADID